MCCKVLCSFLCSLILWVPGFGQEQKPAPKTYVLKAARMFDGKSNAIVTVTTRTDTARASLATNQARSTGSSTAHTRLGMPFVSTINTALT